MPLLIQRLQGQWKLNQRCGWGIFESKEMVQLLSLAIPAVSADRRPPLYPYPPCVISWQYELLTWLTLFLFHNAPHLTVCRRGTRASG